MKRTDSGRSHELCVFLGGGTLALRTSNALRRDGIDSVEELRRQYIEGAKVREETGWPEHPLTDIRLIGEKAMELIEEKLGGPE